MSRPTRVVFDTSTLIAAMLGPASIPRVALFEAFRGSEVCTSTEALSELAVVLERAKFNKYLHADRRREFLEIIKARSVLCAVDGASKAQASGVCRDPDDAMLLALAHACEAQVLVSSDEDLLVLHGWSAIAIMKPAVFVEAIQSLA